MINQLGKRFRRTATIVVFALLGLIVSVLIQGVWSQHVAFADDPTSDLLRTYAVDGSPLNIVVEDENTAWFTLPQENALGSLVLQNDGSHQTEKFTLSNAGSEPHDLVIDGNTIWFTQKSGNRIGKFNINDSTFEEYDIPTASSGPTGIDVAPNGRVWFLESDAQKLAFFDPGDESFTEYPLTSSLGTSELVKVKAATSNLIWFTMPDSNFLVSYSVSNDQFSPQNTVSPTGSFVRPIGLAIDDDNDPWTTASNSASDVEAIGRYTPETLVFFRWLLVPTDNSGVANLAIDDLGSTWAIFFTEADSGKVGRRLVRASDTRKGLVTEYSIGHANSSPWGIDVDAGHKAWIADSGANLIAVWRAPYTDSNYLPLINK